MKTVSDSVLKVPTQVAESLWARTLQFVKDSCDSFATSISRPSSPWEIHPAHACLKVKWASREDIIGSRNVGEDGNASVVTRTMSFVGLVWLLSGTRRPWGCMRFLGTLW